MSNKRKLKKQLNQLCEELLVDFIAASLYGNAPSRQELETIFLSISKLQKNYTSRICHPEPGMPASKYFKDLKEKLSKDAQEIVDHINNL